MNLNDLLPLLFVLLLVGSSLLRRGRGGPPRRPPGERPEAPPRGPTPAEETRTTTERHPGQGREASPGGGDEPLGELRSRLEEARRRVREAAGGEQASTGPATAERTPGGSLAGGAPERPASLGRPTHHAPSRAADEAERRRQADHARRHMERPAGDRGPLESAPPMQRRTRGRPRKAARRTGTAGSAKLSAAELLAFEREDIVRGFVWSVIFSDPVAPRRRKVSPRRLP